MACKICGFKVTELHHIKTRKSGGTDDEWNLLEVCRKCHTMIHQYGYKKFSEKCPIILQLLNKKGWSLVNQFGLYKLVRTISK